MHEYKYDNNVVSRVLSMRYFDSSSARKPVQTEAIKRETHQTVGQNRIYGFLPFSYRFRRPCRNFEMIFIVFRYDSRTPMTHYNVSYNVSIRRRWRHGCSQTETTMINCMINCVTSKLLFLYIFFSLNEYYCSVKTEFDGPEFIFNTTLTSFICTSVTR